MTVYSKTPDMYNADISDIFKMYEQCGYYPNGNQKAFIEKYAFTEIHYSHPIWNQDMLLRVNPIEAQTRITMDLVKEYNDFLKDDLLIIGDIEKENLTLFLSKSGFYFSAYDDCLINWGNSFEAMLDKLKSGDKGNILIIG